MNITLNLKKFDTDALAALAACLCSGLDDAAPTQKVVIRHQLRAIATELEVKGRLSTAAEVRQAAEAHQQETAK